MDERVMRVWVQRVLKPYVEEVPLHITPLLILDSYRCHTMPTVVSDIQALGCEIEIIPGGCTGLCQPIDVGIGKPLKSRARHLWEEWMVQECTTNNAAATRPPSRLLMNGIVSRSVSTRNTWVSVISKPEGALFSSANRAQSPPAAASALSIPIIYLRGPQPSVFRDFFGVRPDPAETAPLSREP